MKRRAKCCHNSPAAMGHESSVSRREAVLGMAGLITCAASGNPISAASAEKVFRAGAYAIDITPAQFPVYVNGGFAERSCDTVVDRLHARCLVLHDGHQQIAIVVVDTCLLSRNTLDEAKRLAFQATRIAEDRMLISATHTHTAPSVVAVLGSRVNEAYAAGLPKLIAEGITRAQKNLAPARVGWAVGKDPKNVFCRRFLMKPGTAKTVRFTGHAENQAQMNPGNQNPNAVHPTGPADDDVSLLAVETPDGRPLAVLANYSTHYAGSQPLSADYFGVFCQRMGELLGAKEQPAFVGLMSNGTSGDANCNDARNPKRKYDRFTVAEDVVQAALTAYRTIRFQNWVPLAMVERRLTLSMRAPTATEVAEAKQYVAAMNGRMPKTMEEVYAHETLIISQIPPTRELKLQAIRIGDLGIAATPCEVYGITGLTIKRQSPLKPTFNISLANGYDGYLPPPEQHKLGGYTTWRARSSCLEVEAEPKIRTAVLELLQTVATA